VGLFDHRRTWHFKLTAPPERCLTAFTSAFDGSRRGGPVVARAKWSVSTTGRGAVATYKGRAGLVKGVTMLSSRASNEEDAAIGSQVSFEVEPQGDGLTVCTMWLSSSSNVIGFTADGRFFRPYMRMVQDRLGELDPAMQFDKA
jgi:hypothetical protein